MYPIWRNCQWMRPRFLFSPDNLGRNDHFSNPWGIEKRGIIQCLPEIFLDYENVVHRWIFFDLLVSSIESGRHSLSLTIGRWEMSTRRPSRTNRSPWLSKLVTVNAFDWSAQHVNFIVDSMCCESQHIDTTLNFTCRHQRHVSYLFSPINVPALFFTCPVSIYYNRIAGVEMHVSSFNFCVLTLPDRGKSTNMNYCNGPTCIVCMFSVPPMLYL